MAFLEIILTIIAAIIIGLLFYYVFRITGPWGTLWTFLLILILAGLAAELWIPPVGPVFYDIAWIPTLFVIVLFALILAAASPSARREIDVRESTREGTGRANADSAAVALGVFFWFLLLFLFIAVFWGVFI